MTQQPLSERLRRRLRRSVLAPLDARVGGAVRRRLNAGRDYRPIFVSGAMGSGTTLLALSLAQRFDVACVITESAHQVDAASPLHNPGVGGYARVRDYRDAILPRADWSVERAREDLLALYRSYASGSSGVAVDKGPNTHLVRAEFLARCFPEARFAAVFRDPVATVEGFRRKWPEFGAEPLESSIDFYREIHERFLEQTEPMGDRVVWLEYERFVERYDEALDVLAGRFGLKAASRRRRLPGRGNYAGQGIRNVRRSQIGVVADANRRAYEQLDPDEVRCIRAGLEPLHERLRALATPL